MKITTNQRRWLSFTKVRKLSFLFGVTGSVLVVSIVPTLAIEESMSQEKVKTSEVAGSGGVTREAQKRVAVIGLGGGSCSKTLSVQLGLADGVGLTIFYVVPNSPADKAGLMAHDVMVSFAGEPVGSQKELKKWISKYQPGDEVVVRYLHQGKVVERKVTLGDRSSMSVGRRGAGTVPEVNTPWMFKGLGAQISKEDRLRIEAKMRQHMQQLQQQLKNQGKLQLQFQGVSNPKANQKMKMEGRVVMNAHSSITMSDQDGSVTMNSVEGKKQIVVRDENNKIIFEGPYDTAQDKASIPESISERLRHLNLESLGNAGLQIEVPPHQLPNTESSQDDESMQ